MDSEDKVTLAIIVGIVVVILAIVLALFVDEMDDNRGERECVQHIDKIEDGYRSGCDL